MQSFAVTVVLLVTATLVKGEEKVTGIKSAVGNVTKNVADDIANDVANDISADHEQKEKEKESQTPSKKPAPPKNKGNKGILIVKPLANKQTSLIWGFEWWELICIIFGSLLILLFACVCCCAILESGQIQRQEVRGPNGERLGFLQAPGRHIVLVMDNRFSRLRTNINNGATANNQAVPMTAAATAQQSAANPPHGPSVQPLHPKV